MTGLESRGLLEIRRKWKRRYVEKTLVALKPSIKCLSDALHISQDVMTFQLLMKMSGEACTSKTLNCAPVVHYEKRKTMASMQHYTQKSYYLPLLPPGEHKNIVLKLSLDALGVVRKTTKIPDLMEVLKGCLQRQVHEMGRSVLSELKMRGTTSMPEVCTMLSKFIV